MTPKVSILEELRGRLLDLSLRNNLLNYRPHAARSIEIVDEHISEIYNILVLKEKVMKFSPSGKGTPTTEEKNLWKYPIFSVNPNHTDQILNTPYTDIELRKKLYALQNKSRTVFEEQGYPILYLALCFIEWSDANSNGIKSPLLLIPVNLNKQKVKENYTLSWSGEDPIISPTLQAKFAEDGIILPEFGHPETKEDLSKYLESVVSLIKPKNWSLIPNIALDLFSFKKYVMYKDLDSASWGDGFTIENNPLIRSIFSPTSSAPSPEETPLPMKSSDFSNILDADSSQLAVIAEAKTGKNLVVEGPPGTGKSQTIANMIAEMLAEGKSVLFVSEKMAALQVVKRRLDSAGLSRFILELHSQNAKKTEFLRELESCLQYQADTVHSSPVLDDPRRKTVNLSNELSEYCNELKTEIGACQFTPYDLFGIREQYRYEFETVKGKTLIPTPLDHVAEITPEQYHAAIAALTDIESYMPTLLHDGETVSTHPWASSNPGRVMPTDRDEIRRLATEFRNSMHAMNSSAEQIANALNISYIPKNEEELKILSETGHVICTDLPLTEKVLENPLWINQNAISSMIARYKRLCTMKNTVDEIFTPDISSHDVHNLYVEFLKYSKKGALARMFSSGYKNLKTELRSCMKNPEASDSEIINGLKEIKIYYADLETWKEQEQDYSNLFNLIWTGDNTNPDQLESYATWIRTLISWGQDGRINNGTVQNILTGKTRNLDQTITEMEKQYADAKSSATALMNKIGMPDTTLQNDFNALETMATKWVDNIDRLESWSRFLLYIGNANETVARTTANMVLEGILDTESIIPSFIAGYTDALLKEAYASRPVLAQFAQSPHEQKIETFRILDRKVINENASFIAQKLSTQIPVLFDGSSRESEMGILAGEFNRKRGHMAIRTLMTKAGGLIQKIKPCFMMSPLSVAQYLDPRSVTFDIIIFDEASQVKPEDALGALMRGKQLVVMGDSRQLPPTSFFDTVGGNDDGDESSAYTQDNAAEITDMESLLHACKQVYPTRRLTWHYRSRHESLIAVSNIEFYDGSLFVFPSPKHNTADVGLSFVHTEGSIYERGKGGANRGEAKAVANAVIEYYTRYPDKTLGVATFSVKQQETIRNEVELLLQNHPEVESLMHANNGEDFFVKNLETVQGDERDTILISIGYGFDDNHKLSRNFGPLNQAGGERRLNVLITRARERCVVFSNFRGYDLSITDETPRGVAALASFLIYAETRNIEALGENASSSNATDLFADTVGKILEDKGYVVTRNVGCAGFKIDIAVSTPDNTDVFIAGILCDGHNYWSATDTRDRDRLRSQILEGLGWHLIRIWAPEWFCSPSICEKKLIDALETAKQIAAEPEKQPVSLEMPRDITEKTTSEYEEDMTDETKEDLNEDEPDTEPKNNSENEELTDQETEIPLSKPTTSEPDEPGKSTESSPKDVWEEPKKTSIQQINTGFHEYTEISECVLQKYHQFSSVPATELSVAIVEIAIAEGPLSEQTLFTRIKKLGNVPRMTPTIKNSISEILHSLEQNGQIERDDEGFISIPGGELFPRIRGTKWSITDVSLSELLLASELILARQHTTPKDELARITASLLGFKAIVNVRERCEKAIDMGIRLGRIEEHNGMCSVKS